MRSTEPPTIARWILVHFGCSSNNESVIGDLDERYRQGRSAIWYWHQASVALAVGFFSELRTHKSLAVKAIIQGWSVSTLTIFFVALANFRYFYAALNVGDRVEAGAFFAQLQTEPLIGWLMFAWGVWSFTLAGYLVGRGKDQYRTLALMCFAATFPVMFALPLANWSEIGIAIVDLLAAFLGGGLLTNSGHRERAQ